MAPARGHRWEPRAAGLQLQTPSADAAIADVQTCRQIESIHHPVSLNFPLAPRPNRGQNLPPAHTDFSGIGLNSKHITGFFGALKSAYTTDMDYPAQSADRATPLRLLEYVRPTGPEESYERYADFHERA